MKKIFLTLLLAVIGFGSASAQFEKGKYYLGATSNIGDLSYSKNTKLGLNVGVNAGYMLEEAWLAIVEFGFDYHNSKMQQIYAGAKWRYLIEQNGLFLQLGGKYSHFAANYNDVQVTPEVGYCYFLNRSLTIEPSIYYDISLTDFNNRSKVGVKVGLACYF